MIPTRNRRRLLEQAIGDALGQRGVGVRCIVVDDASDDGTPEAVEALEDPRVVLVRLDGRRGVAAARNEGIRHGDAPWVAFLDDDDRWAPQKLQAQLAALAAEPQARWAVGGCVSIDQSFRVLGGLGMPDGGGALFERLLVDCVVPAGGSNVLVSRGLVESVGGFDEQLRVAEDWDLWLRLAELAPIAYVDRPLVAYRRWGGNESRDPEVMRDFRRRVLSRYGHLRDGADHKRADIGWEQWRAGATLRGGRRVRAAWLYARIALVGRSPGQAAYAVGSLVAPRAVERRLGRIGASRVPAGWAEEAESWLGTSVRE